MMVLAFYLQASDCWQIFFKKIRLGARRACLSGVRATGPAAGLRGLRASGGVSLGVARKLAPRSPITLYVCVKLTAATGAGPGTADALWAAAAQCHLGFGDWSGEILGPY